MSAVVVFCVRPRVAELKARLRRRSWRFRFHDADLAITASRSTARGGGPRRGRPRRPSATHRPCRRQWPTRERNPSQNAGDPNSPRRCRAGRVTRCRVCSWVVPDRAVRTWSMCAPPTARASKRALRATTATRNWDSSPSRSSVERASARRGVHGRRGQARTRRRCRRRGSVHDWNFARAQPNCCGSGVLNPNRRGEHARPLRRRTAMHGRARLAGRTPRRPR